MKRHVCLQIRSWGCILFLALLGCLCSCAAAGSAEPSATAPTGDDGSAPKAVYYNKAFYDYKGIVYHNADQVIAEKGWSRIGAIAASDHTAFPTKQLHASNLPVGSPVYADGSDKNAVYVKVEQQLLKCEKCEPYPWPIASTTVSDQ